MQGNGNEKETKDTHEAHAHVRMVLVFVARLLEGEGGVVAIQVTEQADQHLRPSAKKKKRNDS